MTSTTNSTKPGSKWSSLLLLMHWPWELIPLVALFAWLYRQTMPPGISSWIIEGWDSAMLQITGSTWGIPHSPGYPLYTILANFFVRGVGFLPGIGDTSVVWRVSFWSTVTSLLTLILLYLIVRRLARDRVIAVTTSAIIGLSFIFWRASIMAEVYSLNALIFTAAYWLTVVWSDDRRDRWLMILGLVLGAGVVHHRTALILPPTVALWVLLNPTKKLTGTSRGPDRPNWWRLALRRLTVLVGFSLVPTLAYAYLPLAAQYRAGQTWIYADTSDWNIFWFVVLTREWWGLVQIPPTTMVWLDRLAILFYQQADQITAGGVIAGTVGLLLTRQYLWLLGPSFLTLTFFGLAYNVADLDSMLIPLTLTLGIGAAMLVGLLNRRFVWWLLKSLRFNNKDLRGNRWLSTVIRYTLSVLIAVGAYFLFRPLAEANYKAVDLSGDWQAEDLVEEVVAIAGAGTPLTIIGQDNSVLPDFIYTQVVLGQPVEPLSTTTLSRMPEAASINLLRSRFEEGRRVFVDIETIDLGFIPWLNQAIDAGQILLAPTGHPFLWELLPRPMSNILPENEAWIYTPPGQFLDGQVSIIAFHEQVIHKRTGCFLRLTLFWRIEGLVEADYFVAVQPLGGETVLDKNDHLALMRGFLPTSQLQFGEIVRDEVDLLIRQPAALPGVNLVVNLYQVQGDQYPTFGEMIVPITVDSTACSQ